MAKTIQAQDQTMEEILASIRRIISDDEARGTQTRTVMRPVNNVSHLFAEPPAHTVKANIVEMPMNAEESEEAEPVEPEATGAAGRASRTEALIDEAAFAAAIEPERVPPARPEPVMTYPKVAATPRPPQNEPPLLSARSDAAVSTSFSSLTDTLFAGSGRTVEGLVEDMLRPMLKSWLDNNLPPLVERLVREEIERVSRRRR
jgi:cell pole-organizing protein PopZ